MSEHSLAGTTGGIVAAVIAQPFELVKTRMQTMDGAIGGNGFRVAGSIVGNEGPLALFRGLATPLVGYLPTNIVVFGAYGGALKYLRERSGTADGTIADKFSAGFFAGVVQTPICAPVETVKVIMMSQMTGGNAALNKPGSRAVYRNSLEAVRGIVAQDGVSGLFRGVAPTLLRDSFGYGIYFAAFAWFQELFGRAWGTSQSPIQGQARDAGHVATFVSGGLAGMACYAACFPVDTVKSRVQASTGSLSMAKATRDVLALHGVRGLYAGVGPCLARAFPENAAMLYVYDRVVRMLDARKNEL